MCNYKKLFEGRRILVTGGTGSIGGPIVEMALRNGASYVKVLSRHPVRQTQLAEKLSEYVSKLDLMIGSVKDKEDVEKAMEDVDYVFHAAADKFVDACERNPLAALRVNVMGTYNVIECASKNGTKVKKVVIISTDKSVFCLNAYGATKLLAEKIACTQASGNYRQGKLGTSKPVICCVRFGNVAASRGSAIPIFVNQIYNGGPVTLTDERMTRFMMSIPQAVDLVAKAAEHATGGEIFVLKMKALNVKDLVRVMIKLIAPQFGKDPNKIEIQIVGARPGEKLHEHLITPEELSYTAEMEDMYKIIPLHLRQSGYVKYTGTDTGLYSANAPKMTDEEIEELLDRIGILQPNILQSIVRH